MGLLLACGPGVFDGDQVMKPMETAVYRVCASAPDRWEVYQDPAEEPVASFSDKSAALTYAMCLARGRTSWHLLLGGRTGQPRGGLHPCAHRA